MTPRGVRVEKQHAWPVGSHVVLSSSELGVQAEARVLYCQHVAREKFAVGRELLSPEKEWSKTH